MSPVPIRIANARGVPGCAGMLDTNRRLLVTNHHVAFGDGALPGDPIWAIPPSVGVDVRNVAVRLGTVRHGAIGRIGSSEVAVFVDCALIELAPPANLPAWLAEALAQRWPQLGGRPALYDSVRKTGPASGTTEGRILVLDHYDHPADGDARRIASGQLLIGSSDPARVFAAPGDSGAFVTDADGRAVGLLWGVTGSGDGIASPIAAVLEALCLDAHFLGKEELV
ncbi:hypothetical protein ACN2CC_02155 [Mesorhizobium muleiense]|uniref:hypothetical protein n=1 Tax=Mesorhizobium muleiense TaxID=1004279 RepID=UPI003AFA11CC